MDQILPMLDLLTPLHVSTVSAFSFLGLFFNALGFHFLIYILCLSA